jgi:DNA (cytosine-5)-methyltransferase 1
MQHHGNIKTLNGGELPAVDVITGGSPCQDLSIAGKMSGLKGERSGLFLEQIRIVKQMREHHKKPRFMVWENVPGALVSNSGNDFLEVLNECVRVAKSGAPSLSVPKDGWPNVGCLYDAMGKWSVAWRVHNAQFWGVPQRRRRIALVCDFGGLSAPEVLFEREGVSRDSETLREKRECASGNHPGSTSCAMRECVFSIANGQAHTSVLHDVSNTLTCMHDHETIVHRGMVRRLTPLECTRLQGFPDGWCDIGEWVDSKGKRHKESDSVKYRALGNSLALPFWRWLMRRIYNEIAKCEHKPTLGSLFDGIGGFPLCFPGETKWASEIDEFCIAVTKKHFDNKEASHEVV